MCADSSDYSGVFESKLIKRMAQAISRPKDVVRNKTMYELSNKDHLQDDLKKDKSYD